MVQVAREVVNRFPKPDEVLLEPRLSVVCGRWGYADRIHLYKSRDGRYTKATLIDYKFGMGHVDDASVNLQGLDYAMALMREYSDLEEVETVFIVPRQGYVSSHTYFRHEYEEKTLLLVALVERARRTSNKRIRPRKDDYRPSVDACQYCGRKATCPALRKIAEQASKAPRLRFEGGPLLVDPTEEPDLEKLSKLLEYAKVLKEWAEHTIYHIQRRAVDEAEVPPGYALKERRGPRKARNPVAVQAEALSMGLTYDDVWSVSEISITKLEEMIRARAPKGEGNARVRAFRTALERAGAIVTSPPTRYLAKERDVR